MENWIMLWILPSRQQFSFLQQIQEWREGKPLLQRNRQDLSNEKRKKWRRRMNLSWRQSKQISLSSPIWERVSCYVSLQSQSICPLPPFHRHVSPSSPLISCFLIWTPDKIRRTRSGHCLELSRRLSMSDTFTPTGNTAVWFRWRVPPG